jgi:hypothetical protein
VKLPPQEGVCHACRPAAEAKWSRDGSKWNFRSYSELDRRRGRHRLGLVGCRPPTLGSEAGHQNGLRLDGLVAVELGKEPLGVVRRAHEARACDTHLRLGSDPVDQVSRREATLHVASGQVAALERRAGRGSWSIGDVETLLAVGGLINILSLAPKRSPSRPPGLWSRPGGKVKLRQLVTGDGARAGRSELWLLAVDKAAT